MGVETERKKIDVFESRKGELKKNFLFKLMGRRKG